MMIIKYLTSCQPKKYFEGMAIDEADHEKSLSDPSNIIPKFVIILEKFYDLQDKFR